MAPTAIINTTEEPSHFPAGGPSVQTASGPLQQPPHIFPECGKADGVMVVDPSVCDVDGLCAFFDKAGGSADVLDNMNMPSSEPSNDEDFWFPADLFTDELNYNEMPNSSAEVVSHSSGGNSTIYSDEIELEIFEEVPQTIDVPKAKRAKTSNEQFSTNAHSSKPLLASWQPASKGSDQFSNQVSPFQAPLRPPPSMATPGFATVASPAPHPVNNSVKVTKPAQIKDLLAILCENISSDPNQSVQDLMTLRLLLIRPQLTSEEDHLLDTVLILFESYLTAGRSRPDIATMVVRDFSFHFKHQAQAYAAMTPMSQYASPVILGQTPSLGFLPPPNTVSPRSSISY